MEEKFEDQITLFLDFLGFSEASVQADELIQSALLRLLHSISAMRSDFFTETTDGEAGTKNYKLIPAVSTFSDHIVVSYPIGRIEFGGPRGALRLTLLQFERLVSIIAMSALPLGFLIRGGISLGKLYHSDGVVFGPAMIEAYKLESQVALYPRVVLSPALSNHPDLKSFDLYAKRDTDGLVCLEYFRSMVWNAGKPGEEFYDQINTWFDTSASIIKEKLESLSDSPGARSKWVWFNAKLIAMFDANAMMFENSKINVEKLRALQL